MRNKRDLDRVWRRALRLAILAIKAEGKDVAAVTARSGRVRRARSQSRILGAKSAEAESRIERQMQAFPVN
jgi:hypothetical protein